jgi:hypothetical protein
MTDHNSCETWAVAMSKKHKVVAVVQASNGDSLWPGSSHDWSTKFSNVATTRIKVVLAEYNFYHQTIEDVRYLVDEKGTEEEKMEVVAQFSGNYDSGDIRRGYTNTTSYTVRITQDPFNVTVGTGTGGDYSFEITSL